MASATVLKATRFYWIYEIRKNIEFQEFRECDFSPVIKNREKRRCISYLRTFQILNVTRLNLNVRQLGILQIGMAGVWPGSSQGGDADAAGIAVRNQRLIEAAR